MVVGSCCCERARSSALPPGQAGLGNCGKKAQKRRNESNDRLSGRLRCEETARSCSNVGFGGEGKLHGDRRGCSESRRS